MTVSEAAEVAGVSVAYMRSMAASGEVKAEKKTVGHLQMWEIPEKEALRIRDQPRKSRGIKRLGDGKRNRRKSTQPRSTN